MEAEIMKSLQKALLVAGICRLLTVAVHAQDIDSIAPVVVKTVPEAGSKAVAPGTVEIRGTFRKPMADQFWSWGAVWKDSNPALVGRAPSRDADKTVELKAQ